MRDRSTLIATICASLESASLDELRVFQRIMERVAVGRDQYGPLSVETDHRDWRKEAAAELTDCLFYLAVDDVARQVRAGK